jgi:hypothetical protein
MVVSGKKMVRGFALGLATLSLMAFIVTPSGAFAQNDQTSTVGDFLTAYAKAIRIELPSSADADVVLAALRASGVKLDEKMDLSKALTQADVVKIGKANGIRLTSRNPQAAFTTAEINQFFTTYGITLSPAASNGLTDIRIDAAHPNPGTGKGGGKKKGHQSPSDPD